MNNEAKILGWDDWYWWQIWKKQKEIEKFKGELKVLESDMWKLKVELSNITDESKKNVKKDEIEKKQKKIDAKKEEINVQKEAKIILEWNYKENSKLIADQNKIIGEHHQESKDTVKNMLTSALTKLCSAYNNVKAYDIGETVKWEKEWIIKCKYEKMEKEEKKTFSNKNSDKIGIVDKDDIEKTCEDLRKDKKLVSYLFWHWEISKCNKCSGKNFTDDWVCCDPWYNVAYLWKESKLVCCSQSQVLNPWENSENFWICCESGITDWDPAECISNEYGAMGLYCPPDALLNWSCSMTTYDMLQIRKNSPSTDVWMFVQDIILWLTSFIWVVATVSLLVSWFKYVMAASWEWNVWSAKNWIIYSLAWIFLVAFSYAIIRLVQYIAAG